MGEEVPLPPMSIYGFVPERCEDFDRCGAVVGGRKARCEVYYLWEAEDGCVPQLCIYCPVDEGYNQKCNGMDTVVLIRFKNGHIYGWRGKV